MFRMSTKNVQVQCPPAATPGTTIQTIFDGQTFDVQVPEGVQPGEVFEVQIPTVEPTVELLPSGGGDIEAQFREMDADGDGMLTKNEVVAYCATHDAARNALGLKQSGWANQVDALFEEMDEDGSDSVSLAEFVEWKNTHPHPDKIYQIKTDTTVRAGKESNSGVVGTLARGDCVVVLEEATDAGGARHVRTELGWIADTPKLVEAAQGADPIVVQMKLMDVGTDAGTPETPGDPGTTNAADKDNPETDDSKAAEGSHRRPWVESERELNTAVKTSSCSGRICVVFMLQMAFFLVVAPCLYLSSLYDEREDRQYDLEEENVDTCMRQCLDSTGRSEPDNECEEGWEVCVFPFEYGGVVYSSCADGDDGAKGDVWIGYIPPADNEVVTTVTLQTSGDHAQTPGDITVTINGADGSSTPRVCTRGVGARTEAVCAINHEPLGDLQSITVALTGNNGVHFNEIHAIYEGTTEIYIWLFDTDTSHDGWLDGDSDSADILPSQDLLVADAEIRPAPSPTPTRGGLEVEQRVCYPSDDYIYGELIPVEVSEFVSETSLFFKAAFGVLICFMLCEVKGSPSGKFLKNIMKDSGAFAHVETVRKAVPSLHWHIQCYHHVSLDLYRCYGLQFPC